jgi:DNA polymerase V
MVAMDQIDTRFGRGSTGFGLERQRGQWRMKREHLSPNYTTQWKDLPKVWIQ